jgi:hypothetical protein
MSAALHPSRMGLEPLPLEDWLKPQPGDAAVLAERARLIAAHRRDVIAALPESEAAIGELAATLRERGIVIGQGETLPAIGRGLAEDICILTDAGAGYRLTAGILCFPNRWKLTEKIGGNVLAVHGPVPDYAADLSAGVDRFLDRLKPSRAYLRRNWGLSTSEDLFLPEPTPAIDPREGGDFFLRREDQSFLKLPESGAVIFAIRTTVTPWADTPADLQADILATVGNLSAPWLDYKSLKPRH